MPNIFVTPDQIRGNILRVQGGDAAHLGKVLRLGPGDRFSALDGTGREYMARIIAVEGGAILAEVIGSRQRRTEAGLRLILGQALPKGDKMEQVIRQGTELGMAGFRPLLTERCVPMPGEDRAGRRLQRWRRVAAEAAQQSGRAAVPEVAPLAAWREIVRDFHLFDLVILAWEGENRMALKDLLAARPQPGRMLALIGPEGGLTGPEVEEAEAAGAVPVTLGPRVLRTETAGLVLGAAVFYHYGELRMIED